MESAPVDAVSHGPAEVVDEAPLAELTPAVRPKAAPEKVQAKPSFISAGKEHWLFHNKLIELYAIEFDLEARQGQIRPLDPDILKSKRAEFSMQPPLGPVQCLLVATDVAGM